MHPRTRVSRRAALAMLAGAATLPLSGCTVSRDGASPKTSGPSPTTSKPSTSGPPADSRTARAFGELERRFEARLGVYALDTGSGRTVIRDRLPAPEVPAAHLKARGRVR
ncbi:hypothetical protein [Streptomyces exfoliatus]|uniref:hypothetical protein n=1 Tax=Streptomyces exfoliatus TaxID=1905 RepID=UPI003C2C1295